MHYTLSDPEHVQYHLSDPPAYACSYCDPFARRRAHNPSITSLFAAADVDGELMVCAE
jgi:hypothetical protein